jgi:hypothetical protein
MRTLKFVALSLAALLLAASVATADRKPTHKERRAIAKVLHLPPRCAAVRVSTVTRKPVWASVAWRNGRHCMPFAADGVAVSRKTHGRWRFITAGSSFDCGPLYQQVPIAVVQDLGITCI